MVCTESKLDICVNAQGYTNSFCWLQKNIDKIVPFLGNWKGHSITKRSGVYGATIDEADTVALLEMDGQGQLIQVFFLICSNHLLEFVEMGDFLRY